ncbi:TetR/AcrR family transcriptional regulator [Myxococcus sp. CA056]|uniref:TetR/AcrR family transcriptional regulator n=1 Tax=Myxococcus sp. CA056 TaxID=2741740 RepID=UPI00157A63FA|nr:TetR/AcrR family transcriptional regulator [Myxococcus sp. CA056]NTX14939.1 TetR/AcrR family transcriptional regulator [Myxococcus sp. CA056]
MVAAAKKKPVLTRDPEGVRKRILTEGTRLFAERGFAGTSFRDVANAAGVSVSLIQHHFGTKESLYAIVKAHAVEDSARAHAPAPDDDGLGLLTEEGLQQLVGFFRASPEWSRLAAWAALEGDLEMWPGEDDFVERQAAQVRAAQRNRAVAKDVDPELLLIAMAGLMKAWVSYSERHAHRLRHLGSRAQRERAYLALCLKLLRNGVLPSRA